MKYIVKPATAAKQCTIAALLPQLDELLKFPSGDALDLIRPLSSKVMLRTTYLTKTMRISRPLLDLGDDSSPFSDEGVTDAVFVYARTEDLM